MTDISDDQVDELLHQAERRLKYGAASTVAHPVASGLKAGEVPSGKSSAQPKELSIREPSQPKSSSKNQPKVSLSFSPSTGDSSNAPFE